MFPRRFFTRKICKFPFREVRNSPRSTALGNSAIRPSRRLRVCHSVEHRALHESGHSLHHRRARHGLHGRATATPYLSLSQHLQPRAAARALILHKFSHSRHLHCSTRCSQRENLSTGAPQSHAAGHACVILRFPFMHSPQRRTACRLAASLLFSALRFMQCCINRAKRGRYPSLYIPLLTPLRGTLGAK